MLTNSKEQITVAVDNKMQAKCNICKVTFQPRNISMQALKRHHAVTGHSKKTEEQAKICSFFFLQKITTGIQII